LLLVCHNIHHLQDCRHIAYVFGCLFYNAVGSTATELTQAFSIHASAGGLIILQDSYVCGAATFESTASGNLFMGMPVADRAGVDAGGKIGAWSA